MKTSLLLLAQLLAVSWAHVSLTYPPARWVDLDLLTNDGSPAPCGGQPKGEPKAEFTMGDNITVTWRMTYPHKGGYRIELLPDDYNISAAMKLLPEEGAWAGTDDTTTVSVNVTLPQDYRCDNCTLRLLRQGREFGENFIIWTCADIRIIEDQSELCSNHGEYKGDRCNCNKLYHGDRCQYWDECDTDDNCSNSGKCVDTHANFSPRKQCFCAPGYFGKLCNQVSSVSSIDNLDLTTYRKESLVDHYTLYHRIIDDEIEMVIKAQTLSWAAIGWKPTAGTKCDGIAEAVYPEPEGSAEPEGTAEPEGQSYPEGTAEGNAEHEGMAQNETTAEPEPESSAYNGTAEPEPEGTSEPDGTAEPERAAKGGKPVIIATDTEYLKSQELNLSLAIYECVPNYGDGSSQPEGESEPETKTEPESTAEPEGTVYPEGSAEPESTPEPSAEHKADAEPKPEGETEHAHPMNCADVVTASARGNFSRIHDSFSKDRSTPMPDTHYRARNSLTAAVGAEKDGETTFLIRRKLTADDSYDWPITDDMVVIWAIGQKHLNYKHLAPNGLELCKASDYFYYRKDVLMYHGSSEQRGVTQINFITAADERDSGPSRLARDDENLVMWRTDEDGTVVFTVMAKLKEGDWFSVGLSMDKGMAETDVLHIGIDPSTSLPVFSDRYADGYSLPSEDELEDDTKFEYRYEDGKLIANITRQVAVTYEGDYNLEDCAYLMLVSGSGFNGSSFNKHDSVNPLISDEAQCFQSVLNSKDEPTDKTDSTKKEPEDKAKKADKPGPVQKPSPDAVTGNGESRACPLGMLVLALFVLTACLIV